MPLPADMEPLAAVLVDLAVEAMLREAEAEGGEAEDADKRDAA